jgi:UDP-glucuronate 4-epimerase
MNMTVTNIHDGHRYLVTGVAGFIGMHTAQALLSQGAQVLGVDVMNDYYDVALKEARLKQLDGSPGLDVRRIDLADTAACAALFADYQPTHVIHLAAQAGVRYSITHPHAYAQANLVAFLNVLEGCRQLQVKHLAYASSSSVYGGNRHMPFSEAHSVDHPVSLYAATKKSNELMAHTYSHLYGIPTTGLRFFTVYGPWGRPDMAPYLFTKAIFEGRTIDVFNHGQMRRDFTYIDDIVEGVVRVVLKPATPMPDYDAESPSPAGSLAPYRIFNIGNSQPVELLTFITTLEEAMGRKAQMRMLPMQAGDVVATAADTQLLEQWVGFQPATPLKKGLAAFVAWYRNYHQL